MFLMQSSGRSLFLHVHVDSKENNFLWLCVQTLPTSLLTKAAAVNPCIYEAGLKGPCGE